MMSLNKFKNEKGFTIFELMVSIAIFALMTALLLAKYGNFNQGILLTNLAYDVALSIRNAQAYGLDVKSSTRGGDDFSPPYGVHFDTTQNGSDKFVFFADSGLDNGIVGNGLYGSGDSPITTTYIQRGSKINRLCFYEINGSSNKNCNAGSIDITFRRPDPNAIIKVDGFPTQKPYANAEIELKSTDGGIRTVVVNSTGQISVR